MYNVNCAAAPYNNVQDSFEMLSVMQTHLQQTVPLSAITIIVLDLEGFMCSTLPS